jgi:predicted amidohydrolase YtcJ
MRRVKRKGSGQVTNADSTSEDLGSPMDTNAGGGGWPETRNVVEQLSGALAGVIEDATAEARRAETEDTRRRARGVVFESANAPAPATVPPGLAAIVERVFIPDEKLNEVYEECHRGLVLGADKLAEHGHLVRALDMAETRHRYAHRLFVSAKEERLAYERDFVVEAAPMRKAATELLQKEKKDGIRSKQITDSDVESTIAWLFPDWWRDKERERSRLKLTEDDLLNLVETCASKCRSLQTMLSKSR